MGSERLHDARPVRIPARAPAGLGSVFPSPGPFRLAAECRGSLPHSCWPADVSAWRVQLGCGVALTTLAHGCSGKVMPLRRRTSVLGPRSADLSPHLGSTVTDRGASRALGMDRPGWWDQRARKGPMVCSALLCAYLWLVSRLRQRPTRHP